MGFQLGLYHGVYMIVPYGQMTVAEDYYSHPVTGAEMKTPFDPQNGVKADIKSRDVVIEKYPTPHIIHEKNLKADYNIDMFFVAEFDGFYRSKKGEKKKVFMLNNYSDFHFHLPDANDGFHVELPQIKTDELIRQFKQVHKKYIDLFEAEFGPITFHYGIVAYQF